MRPTWVRFVRAWLSRSTRTNSKWAIRLRAAQRLTLNRLEERVVPDGAGSVFASSVFQGGVTVAAGDVTGDGYADVVTGAGVGGGPHVRVFDGKSGQIAWEFMAYAPEFRGGVTVAVGDVTGDGRADVVTSAGPGGGPHVRVFDGVTRSEVSSFFAFDPGFLGGTRVAVGDADGDGKAEVAVSAGVGGGPVVAIFDGNTAATRTSLMAGDPDSRSGATVALGDLTGDGRAELVVGSGGGRPLVVTYDLQGGATPISTTVAYESSFTGPVWVATGDVSGDGIADTVTGAGFGGGPHVKVFDGKSNVEVASWMAYDPGFRGGALVATTDINADGRADIVTGAGPGGGPHVRMFKDKSSDDLGSFFAYFSGGSRGSSTSAGFSQPSGRGSVGGPVVPYVPPVGGTGSGTFSTPNEPTDVPIDFGWERVPTRTEEDTNLRTDPLALASAALSASLNREAGREFLASTVEQRVVYTSVKGTSEYELQLRISRSTDLVTPHVVTLPEKDRNGELKKANDGSIILRNFQISGLPPNAPSDYVYKIGGLGGVIGYRFEKQAFASLTPRVFIPDDIDPFQEGAAASYSVIAFGIDAAISLVDAEETKSMNPSLIPIAKEFIFRVEPRAGAPLLSYTLQMRRGSNDQWDNIAEAASTTGGLEARFTPRLPGRYFYRLKSTTADGQAVYSHIGDFTSVFPNQQELRTNPTVAAAFDAIWERSVDYARDHAATHQVVEIPAYVRIDTRIDADQATHYEIKSKPIDELIPFTRDENETARPNVGVYFVPDSVATDAPLGSGQFLVAVLHTHPPLTTAVSSLPFNLDFKPIGPSRGPGGDLDNAMRYPIPGFVYDYVGVPVSGIPANVQRPGHPFEDPARVYYTVTSPVRRTVLVLPK